MIWINVYEVDRVYGGPEEGGWYFTTYTPELSVAVLGTEGKTSDDWYDHYRDANLSPDIWIAIEKLRDRLEQDFPHTHRAGLTSYRGGDYTVLIEDREAYFQPEEQPFYC